MQAGTEFPFGSVVCGGSFFYSQLKNYKLRVLAYCTVCVLTFLLFYVYVNREWDQNCIVHVGRLFSSGYANVSVIMRVV